MDNICQLTLKVYVCQCCHELIYFHNAAVDCFFCQSANSPTPRNAISTKVGLPGSRVLTT